jgi:hypothetical protein
VLNKDKVVGETTNMHNKFHIKHRLGQHTMRQKYTKCIQAGLASLLINDASGRQTFL